MGEPARQPLPRIILVDDEPDILFSYEVMLMGAGFNNILTLSDSRDLLPVLGDGNIGAIVLDLQMPHLSGRELLGEIAGNFPHIPVIIVTAGNDLSTAVACMKEGAFDYQVKPIEVSRFVASIRKALEISDLRREISSLRESLLTGQVRNEDAFAAIVTRSPKMKALFGYVEAVAGTDQPVLITGETGVGKELVAGAIHRLSRARGKFVAVNSGGLDDLMFADTLFGHRKGAFTGADQAREGMIAQAAGGTLFLDEIGDLSILSQVKLLRLLQEGEYHPLGADTAVMSGARVIVATNHDLAQRMASGTFRKDLYYRLCAHNVNIPPLRERPEDLPLLLDSFLQDAARALGKEMPGYRPELCVHLATYNFPGNVRELKAMVFDAMTRNEGRTLSISSFANAIGKEASPSGRSLPSPSGKDFQLTGRFPTLKEIEQHLIEEALRRTSGNQGAAAALLGLTRQALNKRLSRR
jgi:DNA-binding NtrC family response regulator